MEEEDYREEFKEVGRLAREIHVYAKEAWSMVGHRPRLFEIRSESVLIDCDKRDKWARIWTWSGQQPHFLSAEYTYVNVPSLISPDNNSWHGQELLHPPEYTLLSPLSSRFYYDGCTVAKTERAGVLRDFKDGLAKLFEYIQAECKRGFTECWGSVDAERLWNKYDEEFVNRVNNEHLLACLQKSLEEIESAGVALRSKSRPGGFADILSGTSVFQSMEVPARGAVELAERVKEANKQRKLFVG